MLGQHDIAPLASSEAGFTLLEVLVATMTALLITFAAFGLLQLVSEQSARSTDYLQATQLGNNAMAHVLDELHSACYAYDESPVVEKSSPTTLFFETAYSSESEPKASQVQLHELNWEQETKKGSQKIQTGKLVDHIWTATSGTYPSYSFNTTATPKRVVIGEHIAEEPEGGAIFTYYKYGTEAKQSSETTLGSFTALAGTLSAAEAEKAASVVVSFRQMPYDNSEASGRSVALKSQAVFSFAATIAEPTIVDQPCQ